MARRQGIHVLMQWTGAEEPSAWEQASGARAAPVQVEPEAGSTSPGPTPGCEEHTEPRPASKSPLHPKEARFPRSSSRLMRTGACQVPEAAVPESGYPLKKLEELPTLAETASVGPCRPNAAKWSLKRNDENKF